MNSISNLSRRLIPIPVAVIVLFLSFLLNNVYAEEVMTWNDCVMEAAKNHPDLISAQENLKQSRADKSITMSTMLPQISADASDKKSETDAKKEYESSSYGITGRQLLFDGFKTANDVKAASETINASQYNYAVTSSNIRLRLRAAFTELLRTQKLVLMTEEIALRRKQNSELVKLRYEAGREHRGSLLTSQADLAQAEFEVVQAKRSVSLTQRQLTKELGRRKFISIKANGDFEITAINVEKPNFEYLADNTIFLKELIARKEAARFGLKSARATFFPKVYATAGTGTSNSDWLPDEDTYAWSVGVSVSLPIFEGGSRIAKVSKAKAGLNKAQADEQSGRDSILFTLEERWTEFQNATDRVSVQSKYLEAAEERAKIANAQYSTGLTSFNDWIIIEDNLVNAKKSFLNAQANVLVNEANWIQAKGGTLDYEE